MWSILTCHDQHMTQSFNPFRTLLFFALLLCSATSFAAGNYVSLALPKSVTVELPRNWVAITKNSRITLDALVEAKYALNNLPQPVSDLAFGANLYNDQNKTIAIFNIRYYPDMEISQADASAATASDTNDLDNELHKNIMEFGPNAGTHVTTWIGTRKTKINGFTAFITEYNRAGIGGNKPFRVRLVRIFNEGKSFTITVSYQNDLELMLRPICDKIIQSIQI